MEEAGKGTNIFLTPLEAAIYEAFLLFAEEPIDGEPKRIVTSLLELAMLEVKNKSHAMRCLDSIRDKGIIYLLEESACAGGIAIPIPAAVAQIDVDSPHLYGVLEVEYTVRTEVKSVGKSKETKKTVRLSVNTLHRYLDLLRQMATSDGIITGLYVRMKELDSELGDPAKVKAMKVYFTLIGLLEKVDHKTSRINMVGRENVSTEDITVTYVRGKEDEAVISVAGEVISLPGTKDASEGKRPTGKLQTDEDRMAYYKPSEEVKKLALQAIEGKEGQVVRVGSLLSALGVTRHHPKAGATVYLRMIGRISNTDKANIYLVNPIVKSEEFSPKVYEPNVPVEEAVERLREMMGEDPDEILIERLRSKAKWYVEQAQRLEAAATNLEKANQARAEAQRLLCEEGI